MPSVTSGPGARVREFFAVRARWERPGPTPQQRSNDRWIALGMWAWSALSLELLRSLAGPQLMVHPWWAEHLALLAGVLPLVWRRTHPLLVASALMVHMFVVGIVIDEVKNSFAMQCVYLFALFSGAAWAKNRRAMAVVMVGLMLLLFGSLTYDYTLGPQLKGLQEEAQDPQLNGGIFPHVAAGIIADFIVNIAYCVLGIVGGQAAWQQARSNARLEEQNQQIERQSEALVDRRLVEERLRIARELHDVVAHHVSVMGVQAAAARRVLGRNPDAAATALAHVEESSRQAVSEMRGLLGTLRRTENSALGASDEGAPSTEAPVLEHRAPQPGVDQIPQLVADSLTDTFSATYEVVEDRPGAMAGIPMPLGLSLYRTVQEALANIRRHSTAQQATVVLRFVEDAGLRFVEAEVLDEGRPRGGTSGTGLGLLGMRERIASHGGSSEIGPRATGGYRVRVRFPLPTTSSR